MKFKRKALISFVCVLTGFMIAIQFQSTQKPDIRETRDVWEIRKQLQTEQKKQLLLYNQITESERILEEYSEKSEQEQLNTLKESTEVLKEKAGLTEKKGKGLLITIEPLFENESERVESYPSITPDLLNRLINELNTYGAEDIAIENERIINLTPIRYVNGKTYVNNHALPGIPLKLKVLSPNPKRLLDYVQVSESKDYFAIEDLSLSAEIKNGLVLPGYEGVVDLEGIKVKEQAEAGE
ncbi:DUF881 domain-containing protein [Aquibacillus kalidii]|uniref:DUF881 domain-containing protein n=1 Tax=Aquibacillus kalidii TaxID=2762597 RepID=UPI001648C1E7|nr:DUF881 domain-containing protein [Aquibacillus kalidii]